MEVASWVLATAEAEVQTLLSPDAFFATVLLCLVEGAYALGL